ncbi:hypothetical protein L1887_57411 [Cichorium endivia]|nr:hypothetical protein L1887_57411 [Cichorium endivia]
MFKLIVVTIALLATIQATYAQGQQKGFSQELGFGQGPFNQGPFGQQQGFGQGEYNGAFKGQMGQIGQVGGYKGGFEKGGFKGQGGFKQDPYQSGIY